MTKSLTGILVGLAIADGALTSVADLPEAYVTGLMPESKVFLSWNGKSCRLDVKLPPPKPDEVLRIGPIPCKGVAR